jgi:hypothetical protein
MVNVASFRVGAGSITAAVAAPKPSPRAKWVLPVTRFLSFPVQRKRCYFPNKQQGTGSPIGLAGTLMLFCRDFRFL